MVVELRFASAVDVYTLRVDGDVVVDRGFDEDWDGFNIAAGSLVWEVLQAATDETLPAFLTIPKVKSRLASFSATDVLAAIVARRTGKDAEREPLRTAEYRQFRMAKPEVLGELPPDDPMITFWARTNTLSPTICVCQVANGANAGARRAAPVRRLKQA